MNLEKRFLKFILLTKLSKPVQVFPEICKYSCSKNGEARNFSITREYYEIRFLFLKFRIFESLIITCEYCGWKSRLPAIFAKKVFKNGLHSNLLIHYAKSKIISSRLLNILAASWKMWVVFLGVLISITIIQFKTDPISFGKPKRATFEDTLNKDNLGKIVEIEGTVDYSLSLIKDIYKNSSTEELIDRQPFIPFYSLKKPSDFLVIKGGPKELSNIYSKSQLTNQGLLQNQNYIVVGRVELISSLKNADLNQYFLDELPKAKNLNKPQVVINAYRYKTFKSFIFSFLKYYVLFISLIISSIALQIYIDKKIQLKF